MVLRELWDQNFGVFGIKMMGTFRIMSDDFKVLWDQILKLWDGTFGMILMTNDNNGILRSNFEDGMKMMGLLE